MRTHRLVYPVTLSFGGGRKLLRYLASLVLFTETQTVAHYSLAERRVMPSQRLRENRFNRSQQSAVTEVKHIREGCNEVREIGGG